MNSDRRFESKANCQGDRRGWKGTRENLRHFPDPYLGEGCNLV